MERIEDTEEDVDFRPRRPPEERRYEERGVSGAGDAESRLMEPEPCVEPRGRGAMCVCGVLGVVAMDDRFVVFCLLFESGDLLSGNFGE